MFLVMRSPIQMRLENGEKPPLMMLPGFLPDGVGEDV
jgi:hypothetical protein